MQPHKSAPLSSSGSNLASSASFFPSIIASGTAFIAMIFSSIVTYLSIELHIGCVLASDEKSGVSRTALPCHIKKWCKLYSSTRSIYLRILVTSDPMLLSISCWLLGIRVVFEARASSNGKPSLFSASIALHACFHGRNVDSTYQVTLVSEVHEMSRGIL